MKNIIVITLIIAALATLGNIGFATSTPVFKIGEIPKQHRTEDQMNIINFRVGNNNFAMPMYFTETWGPVGDAAQLRNVYYGQCIKRIDGRCGGYANSDPELSNFYVTLSLSHPNSKYPDLPVEEQVHMMNEQFKNYCESPEENAANLKVSPDLHMIRFGVSCVHWFVYNGVIVTMHFNSGNFPRQEIPAMITHVTAFLDKFRTSPKP
jgi:hypothetical protein